MLMTRSSVPVSACQQDRHLRSCYSCAAIVVVLVVLFLLTN